MVNTFTQELAKPAQDANFATLKGEDDYARYFQMLASMFRLMLGSYQSGTQLSYEAQAVLKYAERFLFTIEALRMKYTYSGLSSRPLWIDLVSSGFPNFMEIQNIATDLLGKADHLQRLSPKVILKREMLDCMLGESHGDPKELLARMSERSYFEMLEEDKLFLPFTLGEVVKMKEEKNVRSYVIDWACYDFRSNCPYVHVMTFDQDADREPLEEKGAAWHELVDVVRAEGSRAPDVAILALAIDDGIESIHPKILKRLCIGPLYSRLLAEHAGAMDGVDPEQLYFSNLLLTYGRSEGDALLFETDETIFSRSQQKVARSILSPRGKVREVFAITETDAECLARKASVVNHNVLLPHWIFQEVKDGDVLVAVPRFGRYQKITYDAMGGITIHGRQS